MSDPADERAAVAAAVRRAEEAAGISRDDQGNEVYADEATPDAQPELQGAVPVVASDQPLVPEPAEVVDTSEQQQEAAAPAAEPTAEELKAQLDAANARIEEQKTMIGRQSAEVGEARELRETISALQSRIDAIAAQRDKPATPPVFTPVTQELIDRNPGYATQAAFEQGNKDMLEVAFEQWKEVDPFTASAWFNDRRLDSVKADHAAQLKAMEEKINVVAAPIAENAERQVWANAFAEVRKTRPDILDVDEAGRTTAERLLEEVAPEYPVLQKILQSGNAKEKAQAIDALYAFDRLGNPEAVKQQLEEAATEAAAEAEAARAKAAAVTSQTTVGQPSVDRTDEELEADAYVQRQKAKPSLARGWTGRG